MRSWCALQSTRKSVCTVNFPLRYAEISLFVQPLLVTPIAIDSMPHWIPTPLRARESCPHQPPKAMRPQLLLPTPPPRPHPPPPRSPPWSPKCKLPSLPSWRPSSSALGRRSRQSTRHWWLWSGTTRGRWRARGRRAGSLLPFTPSPIFLLLLCSAMFYTGATGALALGRRATWARGLCAWSGMALRAPFFCGTA